MEKIRSDRFRLLMQVMEPYFDEKGLYLLHCNYGYLVFTTDKLHKAFGGRGNGQWQDIDDLFYFTISFDAEDKETLKEKGFEIELWCYSDTETRNAWNEIISGSYGLGRIYSKKGFDLVYREEIAPLKEKASERENNTAIMVEKLRRFLDETLPNIEKVLLS